MTHHYSIERSGSTFPLHWSVEVRWRLLFFPLLIFSLISSLVRNRSDRLNRPHSNIRTWILLSRDCVVYSRAPVSHHSSWRGQKAAQGKSVSRGSVKSLADALFSVVWLVVSGRSTMPSSTGCCVKWFVMTVWPFSILTDWGLVPSHTQTVCFDLKYSPQCRFWTATGCFEVV